MACCIPTEEAMDFRYKDVNGRCEECGAETVDGKAYDQCAYSVVSCEYCNSAPCEQAC